ncbi:MAG TPA: amino acid adenylation domain-containing protein [Pyrinomonadaceae bacterium]|nr:amino acid adenylation domain-containing protein [Pyrinomonadaceae bacterium]
MIKKERHDLTPTQEAMLLYALYAPKSPAYFEQFCYTYSGPLNVSALVAACQRAVDRHSILRTSFSWDGENRPLQTVHENATLPFTFCDWSDVGAAEQESRLASFLAADQQFGFDLSQAPLFRLAIIKFGEDSFRIVISNHHLVLDGWSMGILREEVSQTYQALTRQEEIVPAASPDFHHYVDFLKEQKTDLAEGFWRNELAGFSTPNALVIDNAPGRLPAADEEFAEQSFVLPAAITARLQKCAREYRLTMSTLVQAAWAILLGIYCCSDDVVFGITVSGRPYDFPDIDAMVGLFINTLPLRAHLSPREVAASCFQKMQRNVAELRQYETTSLKLIHEWSAAPHNNLPLFETLVVFENFAGNDSALNLGGEMKLAGSHLARTNYPLTMVINPGAELNVRAVYHRSRFGTAAINRLLNHYGAILEGFTNGLERPIGAMSLLTPAEKQTLLNDWSGAGSGPVASGPQLIHRTIEAQAARTPDAIAVEHEGNRLTYSELNARANRLANFMRSAGVRPESLVGICLERSPDMILSVLAVLKAGGAYVPLDPAYPQDRLTLMLEDSGAQLLLSRAPLRKHFPDFTGRFIAIDNEASAIDEQDTENLSDSAGLESLAYVIYTSGSTGKPKGVMIEHRALACFAASASDEYAITDKDRVLQFASLCFDTSAEEIYCALSRGASLVLRTDAMITSPRQFLQSCEQLEITTLDLPTGYWHHLCAALGAEDLTIPPSVRCVILGGEQARSDHTLQWVERAGENVRLLNTYGPTETTVVATTFDLSRHRAGDRIAIGRPLRGTTVYVLDAEGQPVPAGMAGELYIGGAGVARGYLNKPELTAGKFIPNPFGEGRLYRSGDVVKFSAEGDLEFLGRVDNQVKIRGFRIELEEIEEAIRNHQSVSDAVVSVHEDTDGDKRLCAYLVGTGTVPVSVKEVRDLLKSTLPAHMVPGSWTVLDSLPLMPNGKVDRRALPAPEHDREQAETDYVAPQTPTEEVLAHIWREVLKLDRVGVNDNFFELGGHSLLAARVFSELQKKLKIELNLADIFMAPTIAQLAEMIYQRETEDQESDELMSLLSELEELSDEQAHHRLTEEMSIPDPAHI